MTIVTLRYLICTLGYILKYVDLSIKMRYLDEGKFEISIYYIYFFL